MKIESDDDKLNKPWQKMTTTTFSNTVNDYMASMNERVTAGFDGDDFIRVMWLSFTLFFTVGGYWLLRSIKDPIMSAIDGVDYIPQAKIASLFVIFALVLLYNYLLDIYPKQQLFYMMGLAYGAIFCAIGLLLYHPTIGLPNTIADPTRWLGWVSYCAIESFGSMVIQCYWALVNSSVDAEFGKKHYGVIIAGAQIGSILGPTVATQADSIGIPLLYLFGSTVMFLMVGAMYLYVERFGSGDSNSEEKMRGEKQTELSDEAIPSEKNVKLETKKEAGVLEGFYLFWDHDYVKGIFAISSFSMVQVTVIDYMMKVLATEKYRSLHPNDPQAALRGFVAFMGYFGQMTNTVSFLFSFFGTSAIIKRLGFSVTLLAYPSLLLLCTLFVWFMPNLWTVFAVMMVIKGMSYALNNPTKEILYNRTSNSIKFKCKSWIDTFGQRSAKAVGSVVTNQFAHSLSELNTYGSCVGVVLSLLLLYISRYMGRQFEELTQRDEKVGDPSGRPQDEGWERLTDADLEAERQEQDDVKLGAEEEGQATPITTALLNLSPVLPTPEGAVTGTVAASATISNSAKTSSETDSHSALHQAPQYSPEPLSSQASGATPALSPAPADTSDFCEDAELDHDSFTEGEMTGFISPPNDFKTRRRQP